MTSILDSSDAASPFSYGPDKTALVLMDWQVFILEMAGGSESVRPALQKAVMLRDWALKNNIVILHSIIDGDGTVAPTAKGRERLGRLLETIKANPAIAAEVPEIAYSPDNENEHVVLKTPGRVSALTSKGAMELLRERDITSLVLSGLSTSGAVLRTAMQGTDEGFVVSVVEDACADPTEGLHRVLLEKVFGNRTHIVVAEEFVKSWEGMGRGRMSK